MARTRGLCRGRHEDWKQGGAGAVTKNPNMPLEDNRRISTGWMNFNRDLQELYDRPKESLLDLKARMVMSELVEVLLPGYPMWILPIVYHNKLHSVHRRVLF